MAALGLLLLITDALCHWLLEPLLALGTWLLNLAGLPWLPLLLLGWLLAGDPARRRAP
jgi:hypothetical protein